MKLKSPSFLISVSGLPQSGHKTNSCAYCFILSFTLLAGILAPRTRSPDLEISPGVASSFKTYFSRWSACLLKVLAICRKLVTIVLLPSRCPLTFGISKRSFSNTLCGSLSRARLSSCSYSIDDKTLELYINLLQASEFNLNSECRKAKLSEHARKCQAFPTCAQKFGVL